MLLLTESGVLSCLPPTVSGSQEVGFLSGHWTLPELHIIRWRQEASCSCVAGRELPGPLPWLVAPTSVSTLLCENASGCWVFLIHPLPITLLALTKQNAGATVQKAMEALDRRVWACGERCFMFCHLFPHCRDPSSLRI